MNPQTNSSSPREEREVGTPLPDPTTQGCPSVAPGDAPLSELTGPSAGHLERSAEKIFNEVMDRMRPGELYWDFRERLRELKTPLPIDHTDKIIEAISAFQGFPLEKRVEVLNSMLSPERLTDRAAWPIASAPLFRVPPPEVREAMSEQCDIVMRELLLKGTLPSDYIRIAVMDLEAEIPKGRSSLAPTLLGSAAAALSAVMISATPWWVAAPVVAGSCIALRSALLKMRCHADYASGHIAEAVDALAQIHLGRPLPLMISVGTFIQSEYSRAIAKKSQIDAFLISRALRAFGRPANEISSYFAHPRTVFQTGNALVPAITRAFADHGISLKAPLVDTVTRLNDADNKGTVEFLEWLNAAHFMWAARDRDNLRGEFADIILKMKR